MKRISLELTSDAIKDKKTIVYLFRRQAIIERWIDKEIMEVIGKTYGKGYMETFKILKKYCR